MKKPIYIFDEFEYTEYLLRCQGLYQIKQKDLNLLATRYKDQGYDDEYILKRLNFHTKKDLNLLGKINWDSSFQEALRYARVNKLGLNNPISFSKEEIEKILSIDNHEKETLLFFMCSMAKHKYMIDKQNNRQQKLNAISHLRYIGGKKLADTILKNNSWTKYSSKLIDEGFIKKETCKTFKLKWVNPMPKDKEISFICDKDVAKQYLNYKRKKGL